MCILLLSTAHPDYCLILLSNRDEYLSRPTANAEFWAPPNDHVVGGRDLQRSAQGTWLGLTLDGRVAALTNFHEPNARAAAGLVSRGVMVNAYLTPPALDAPDSKVFAEQLITGTGARGAGGFSLVCGRVGEDLAVVSNRMESIDDIKWIKRADETVALSNAAYGDHSWPKVEMGAQKLKELVEETTRKGISKEQMIKELFQILDTNTMPDALPTDTAEDRLNNLTKSILIPALPQTGNGAKDDQGQTQGEAPDIYATQKQTVVLVDRRGLVTYIEKSLFIDGADGTPLMNRFDYEVQGWTK